MKQEFKTQLARLSAAVRAGRDQKGNPISDKGCNSASTPGTAHQLDQDAKANTQCMNLAIGLLGQRGRPRPMTMAARSPQVWLERQYL